MTNPKANKLKLSAQVKSRLLFSREVLIDSQNQPSLINDRVLDDLISRKADASQFRDKMVRNAILPLLVAFALAFGLSVEIPQLSVNLEHRQYLVALAGCASAISLLQAIVYLDSESAYDGLIDSIIIEKSKSKNIDPDILKASHQTQIMFLKTLRKDFNIYDEDSIRTKAFGNAVYGFTTFVVTSLWASVFLILYSSVIYLSLFHFPPGVIGWLFRCFCWVSIFAGVLMQHVPNLKFEVEDSLAVPPEEGRDE